MCIEVCGVNIHLGNVTGPPGALLFDVKPQVAKMHSIFAGRPMSLAAGVRAMHAQTLEGVMGWPLHLHCGHPL